MGAKKILCIGHACLDQIFSMPALPTKGGKYFARGFTEAGGGPAATASVAVARLGEEACLWTRLGADSMGDSMARELESFGVSLDGIPRIRDAVSALAAVAVDDAGERMILGYVDARLPLDAPDWLPVDRVGEFACVLADMRWPGAAAAVLEKAADLGVPSVTDADLVPDAATLQLLVPLADHVVFSEGGLAQYSGESDPEAGLRKTAGQIRGVPYVTMGEKGCLWLEKDGRLEHVPAFRVPVVDTTGAGDVFHGAFAVGLTRGLDRKDTVRFAAAAAAMKCSRPGGRAGIPDKAALDDFLASPPRS